MTAHLALGLMSGTSADGVSAALGLFKEKSFELLGTLSHAYPEEVVKKIRVGGKLPSSELSALNVQVGEVFADTALRLLKKTHTKPQDVFCIGSHGQTVYHGPKDSVPNTFQIGDSTVIAERTGISVVSNFRERDLAVGGEGAPLIPFFDHYFYQSGPIRAFQNIGGIGNVTVVGKGVKEPMAFDTGPGNCLMDLAIRLIEHGGVGYDHQGNRAKLGTMDISVLNEMIKLEYFKRPPPKSTGLELFGEKFLEKYFGEKLQTNPNDVLATLNQLTSISIQQSYRDFIFPKFIVEEIVVSGGGVFNKTLMKKLECLFAPIPVVSIESLGVPAQAKEPLAFAFFGLRRMIGKINHLPSCTGAKKACSLGIITPAS